MLEAMKAEFEKQHQFAVTDDMDIIYGLISDCRKIGGQWMPSHDSVYCEQPASIPANCSPRVAGILRAA